MTIAEKNRLARIEVIDRQIADLTAKRAALMNPPFQPGDRVTVEGEGPLVWTVVSFDWFDPRMVRIAAGQRDRINQQTSELTLAN